VGDVALTELEREWLERVRRDLKASEDNLRSWRQQCNEDYRQYRNVSRAREHAVQNPPDRDQVANELLSQFGQDLHIPIAYSTVETELPRTVQNRPRGLVLPDERSADENVENMRLLVEKQQDAFRYEMLSQEIVKSGFLYGLGVTKGPYWKRVVQYGMPHLERATHGPTAGSPWVVQTRDRIQFDDAWGEECDIFDCAWDPFGRDSYTLRWFAHRTWRDHDYVSEQLGLAAGAELPDRTLAAWHTACALQIRAEDISGFASAQSRMDSDWFERLRISGQEDTSAAKGLHEVWEWWSQRGDRIVILDGQFPVVIAKNGFWHGEVPFHFYRPQTAGVRQLHGISEIEPLADLIRELDVLRTLRRDNALLILQRVMVFDEDAVDRDDLVYGPGVAIPVRSDDPRAHLYALEQPDLPYVGYKEEQALKEDLDRTSGISDTVTGAQGGGAAQTATGAQLITAAANIRIENKSHRYEAEAVTPFTNQQIALNQQMVVQKEIRVPKDPEPGEIDPKPWQWIMLTPAELAGAMSYHVEGGSIAPKNVAQEAQLGQALYSSLKGDPTIDQSRLMKHYLGSQGVKAPSSWILPQPTLPPGFAEAMAKLVGPDKVQQVLAMLKGADQGGQ
jgi:hypothetical protein